MKFCTSCGARAEDPTDRWCGACGAAFPEAESGTSHPLAGAPADPTGPTDEHAWGASALASDAGAWGTGGAAPDPSQAWPAPTAGRKKTPVIIGAALAGVVGVVGIGFGAVKLMSDPSGAESPEAAVQSVLDAITSQDPLAAVQVINPDEAQGLDNAVSLTVDRIKKAGFDQGGKFTDAIDVQFSDTRFTLDEIGEGAAKVIIDAEVHASFDPTKLPEHLQTDADLRADSIDEDLDDVLEGGPWTDWDKGRTEVYLVAVERDGRWYVSPTATALELAADDADVSGGDFDAQTLESTNPAAASPEDAVTGLLGAVENQDLADAAGYLVDGQGDLVRAYEDSFNQVFRQAGAEWQVEASVRTSVAESGGSKAIVTIDEATMGGTYTDEYDYTSGQLTVDGDCVEVDGDEECVGDVLEEVTGIKNFQVVTVQEGDTWRVDLYGTVMRYLEGAAKKLPQDAVAEAFDAPFLAEPQQVEPGQEVALEVQEVDGVAMDKVIEVPVTADKVLRLSSDDDVYFERMRGFDTDESGSVLMVPIEKDGTLRFTVSIDDRNATVRADLVDPTSIADGASMTPGEVYRFAVDGTTTYDPWYGYEDEGRVSVCSLESAGRCDEAYLSDGWPEGDYLITTDDPGMTAPEEDPYADDYYDY